ncbi:unnamed protein product, partial [marine sediment metagenome]
TAGDIPLQAWMQVPCYECGRMLQMGDPCRVAVVYTDSIWLNTALVCISCAEGKKSSAV